MILRRSRQSNACTKHGLLRNVSLPSGDQDSASSSPVITVSSMKRSMAQWMIRPKKGIKQSVSKSPTKPTKKVSFGSSPKAVVVQEDYYHQGTLVEDFNDAHVWYTRNELQSIHQANKQLVVQLLNGECVEENDFQTLDGLEQYLNSKQRHQYRRRVCRAVLEAQSPVDKRSLRRATLLNSDVKIARVYQEAMKTYSS